MKHNKPVYKSFKQWTDIWQYQICDFRLICYMKASSYCGLFGIIRQSARILHICRLGSCWSMSSGRLSVTGVLEPSGRKIRGNFLHNNRNIKIFGFAVIFNFFLRIVMYIICGAVMHGYVPNYMNITEKELNSNYWLKSRYHLQCSLSISFVCDSRNFRRSY